MKVEGKQYCDISKFSIREINKSIAKDIIVNNHYSGIWTKVSYAIGLFYLSDEEHSFFSGVTTPAFVASAPAPSPFAPSVTTGFGGKPAPLQPPQPEI